MPTILAPLDGSLLAEQALPYVRVMAHALGADVHLLRAVYDADDDSAFVVGLAATYGDVGAFARQNTRQQQSQLLLEQNAAQYLEAQAAQLRADGVEVTSDVRYGSAAAVIADVAAITHPALIAMATHGYAGLKRWALGSVAEQVLQATSAPLFVVRDPQMKREPRFKRILVPLDGSQLANQALPLAAEIGYATDAELIVMQAIEPSIIYYPALAGRAYLPTDCATVLTALHQEATQALDATLGKIHDLRVRMHVVSGPAAYTIVNDAAACDADLIVMATHAYSGLRRWAFGSVADHVLHATSTPLLLVRGQSTLLN